MENSDSENMIESLKILGFLFDMSVQHVDVCNQIFISVYWNLKIDVIFDLIGP